jgi:hypothetical protein
MRKSKKTQKLEDEIDNLKSSIPLEDLRTSENKNQYFNFDEIKGENDFHSQFCFCYKTEPFNPSLFLNYEATTFIHGFNGFKNLAEKFYNMDFEDFDIEGLEFEELEKLQNFSQNSLKNFFVEQNRIREELIGEYQKHKMLLKAV